MHKAGRTVNNMFNADVAHYHSFIRNVRFIRCFTEGLVTDDGKHSLPDSDPGCEIPDYSCPECEIPYRFVKGF